MKSEKLIELENSLKQAVCEQVLLENQQKEISHNLWKTNMRIRELEDKISNERAYFKFGEIVHYEDNETLNPFKGNFKVVNLSVNNLEDGTTKIYTTFWRVKPNGETYKQEKNNFFITYYKMKDGEIKAWERKGVIWRKIEK